MARRTFSSDDVVLKSPNDRRLYRLIKLENGLTALLVHDPEIGDSQLSKGSEEAEMEEEEEGMEDEEDDDEEEDDEDSEGEDDEGEDGLKKKKGGDSQTKKAAAAMCVGICSFSDPPEAQGLAHFLEHMLFMGSTEFPDENEVCLAISMTVTCPSMEDAYTEVEHTCYHFEVKREFLKGALTRQQQQCALEEAAFLTLWKHRGLHTFLNICSSWGVQSFRLKMRYACIECIFSSPDANLIRDVSVKNKTDTNSVIELYFQIERAVGVESTRLRALIDLLMKF